MRAPVPSTTLRRWVASTSSVKVAILTAYAIAAFAGALVVARSVITQRYTPFEALDILAVVVIVATVLVALAESAWCVQRRPHARRPRGRAAPGAS